MKKKIAILLPNLDFENIANNFCYKLLKNNFDIKIYKIVNNTNIYSFKYIISKIILFLEKIYIKRIIFRKKIKVVYIKKIDEIFNDRSKNFDIFINLTNNKIQKKHINLRKILYYSLSCYNEDSSHLMGITEVLNKNNYTYCSIERKINNGKSTYYQGLNETLNSFLLNKLELLQNNFNQLYDVLNNPNIDLFKSKINNINKNKNKINLWKLLNFFIIKLSLTIFRKDQKWNVYFENNLKKKFFPKYNPKKATEIKNIKGMYLGDPFLFKNDNVNYLFAEEYDINKKKGHIVSFQLSKYNNTYIRQGTILKEKFHLSFPFVFRDNKKIYMIPESNEKKDIRLYECLEFPHKWKLKKVLIKNIKALDTIIFKKNKLWFLITSTTTDTSYPTNRINIFYSTNGLLTEKWIRSKSPISYFNKENARNAGLIKLKNKFFRINQISSFNVYGHKIQINKILDINKDKYKEKKLKEISISYFNKKKILGTHHLSINNDFIAYDLKY